MLPFQRLMRLRDKRVDVRKHFLLGLHGKMREKFNVALRSLDRRERQIPDGKVQGSGQRSKIAQHLRVYGGSRTTPFFPTFSFPASNCGLIRQSTCPVGLSSF